MGLWLVLGISVLAILFALYLIDNFSGAKPARQKCGVNLESY